MIRSQALSFVITCGRLLLVPTLPCLRGLSRELRINFGIGTAILTRILAIPQQRWRRSLLFGRVSVAQKIENGLGNLLRFLLLQLVPGTREEL